MKKRTLYLITCIFLFCQSCQKEEQESSTPSDQEDTITNDSELGILIKNVTLHDGSYDDIVDNGHCFSINFPYSVRLNSELHTINSVDDYNLLFFEDTIELQFPVTITFSDYSVEIITSQERLSLISESCNTNDEDIECIDFIYPFEVSTFDSNKNLIATTAVEHDFMLFEMMNTQDENIMSIHYPINLLLHNGQTHNASHNTDLLNAITTVGTSCDENDI